MTKTTSQTGADDEAPALRCGPILRDREFRAFCALILQETGIALNDSKRELVCSRLSKRLRHHGFTSYSDYLDFLMAEDTDGAERREMINCITTNKTDFFREPHHFDFIRHTVFPQCEARARAGAERRLRIWSSACSTGEEPYTLAMVIREWAAAATWDIKILASDIDTQVLDKAQAGIYSGDRLAPVPAHLRTKYFQRGAEPDPGTWAARDTLRELITFRQLNLMDDPWPMRGKFDLIFCRNVLIYFNRETQQRILERFAQYLQPHGFLFLGHSENLNWLTNLYTPLGNTIYAPSEQVRPAAQRGQPKPPPSPRTLPPKTEPVAESLPRVSIIVGEVFASREATCVTTLLGSCVAVCLFEPETGIGGMNHFMLPEGTPDEAAPARFGVHAMEMLINEIMKLGGDRRRLQAKIFGGGRVIQGTSSGVWNVSQKNVAFAKEFLATEGIPVIGKCLGGSCGIQVRFQTHTGRAFVRPLEGSLVGTVAEQEERFGREIARELIQPAADQVTLF